MSAVSTKLIPSASAPSRIAWLSSSPSCQPKFMVPRHSRDTFSPERPRFVYRMPRRYDRHHPGPKPFDRARMESVKRLELTPDDLRRLRFAHSPMAEVVTSALALRNGPWPYSRWRSRLGTSTDDLDVFWHVVVTPAGG